MDLTRIRKKEQNSSDSLKNKIHKRRGRISSLSAVILIYIGAIFAGSFLLSIPYAANSGTWTNYLDALFTATSACCITGFVTVDTFTHWSLFGQIIIMLEMELGGIGFMTFIALMTRAVGFKLRYKDRKFLMESVGFKDKNGFLHVLSNIIVGSLFFEIIGAGVLCIRFIPTFGVGQGIYYAFFHSISAFCNAGFDLMGVWGTPYASLTMYQGDVLVAVTLSVLIFMGGLGFICWDDLMSSKFKFSELKLHTQLTMLGSFFLVIFSTIVFYGLEYNNALANLSVPDKILSCFFQAVNARSAGFTTVDMSTLNDASLAFTMLLMFIGAGSGSAGGGIKVTTFIIVTLGTIILATGKNEIVLGGKRISRDTINQALAIVVAYILIIFVSTVTILWIESSWGIKDLKLVDALFECVSAMGTTGMSSSLKIADLHVASRLIIIILMFTGRVGILTLVLTLTSSSRNKREDPVILPEENVMIG